MTAFSSIDMGEVTRLTQAGRLAEAMALLQGRTTAGAGRKAPGDGGDAATARPILDMAAPSAPGGAWTLSGLTQGAAAPASGRQAEAESHPGLAQTLQALRRGVANPGGAGLGLGLGAGRPNASPAPVPPGARFEERAFASDAGSRTYKVFVPSGYAGQALPVVVMLHGCTQDPDDFAAGTRMNDLAEEQTFLVAYPRQSPSANMQKCWNWFDAANQQREGEEPASIVGIARQVAEEFHADRSRIYVAGLSAGGAAAAIMAATYPDVFAAAGVHSGLACGAARDLPSALMAMKGGGGARPKGGGSSVPTIIFHGDGDRTVHPVNADHVAAQAAPTESIGRVVTKGRTPDGISFTRTVQTDEIGADRVEQWVLHGSGHVWSGGSASGSHTDPRGPDASREMIRFFLAHANTDSEVTMRPPVSGAWRPAAERSGKGRS